MHAAGQKPPCNQDFREALDRSDVLAGALGPLAQELPERADDLGRAGLAGQVLASMLLDHFGLFGLVEKQLTLPRVFGAVLLIAGVVLIQFGNSPGRVLAPQ